MRGVHILIILFSFVVGEGAKTFYNVLGVSERATDEEIKKSYRELAKKLHPDKNRDDPKAQQKFIELSEAYTTLSDPQKRRQYDLSRSNAYYRSFDNQHPGSYHRQGHRASFNNGRNRHQHFNDNGFHFEFNSNSGGFVEMSRIAFLLSAIMFMIPIMCLCAPFLTIYSCWRLCSRGGRGESVAGSTPMPSDSNNLPHLTKITLERERRIVIAGVSSSTIKMLHNVRTKFTHDPIYLCQTVLPSPEAELQAIAFCKKGAKYCVLDDSDLSNAKLIAWIEKILNGEQPWCNVDSSMPRSYRPEVL